MACRTVLLPVLLACLAARADGLDETPDPGPGSVTAEVRPAQAVNGSPAGEERYVGLFYGRSTVADASVSATSQCILCVPVSVDRTAHFDSASTAGVRAGVWGGGRLLHVGLALELAGTSVSEDGNPAPGGTDSIDLHYTTLAAVPMVRLPLFLTDRMPGGQLNLYGGIALPLVATGDMSVMFSGLPRTVSGKVKVRGATVIIGTAIRYSHLSLQAEYRDASANVSFSDIGDSGETRLRSKQTVLGLAWRF